jgi:hypothetical protein
MAICATGRAQIIVNGDFETGDFTGWTEFGDIQFNGVWNGEPHGGVYSGYFGPLATGGIRQHLTAAAGDRLIVKFWLVSELGDIPNSCLVTLDGQTVASVTDFTSLTYQQFTATITVTQASPELVFTFSDPPDYLDLDDVEVTLDNGPPSCYANCDGSTTPPVLNIADFTCFLQKVAGGDATANCDASTSPPVLNIADFSCFLQKYAIGCP